MIRRLVGSVVLLIVLAGAIAVPGFRSRVVALVRPEPPPRITPLALAAPVKAAVSSASPSLPVSTLTLVSTPAATASPTATPLTPSTLDQPTDEPTDEPADERTSEPTAVPTAVPIIEPTARPTIQPTPATIEVHGRQFDAYIPAATKDKQFFQYSCEFDAAWVILSTYGIETGANELLSKIKLDRSVEPYIEETKDGFLIHGGDIAEAFSGDYTKNFLARSTGTAFAAVFEQYGLQTTPVHDRAALERALRSGSLVWMKTTVDFNTWRPATWIMPDGRRYQTVLGNDHAVVAMGFSERGVVIRDVLGPTSTNRQRPYEYEVDWSTFMAAWNAQSLDGLAVAPPR